MSEDYATKRELGAVKGRITKLERRLAEKSDAPDPVEAFNEVAGCLEGQIREHEEQSAEFRTFLAKQTADLITQLEELRSALAQLAVAAAETRKIADRCAELLGVRT